MFLRLNKYVTLNMNHVQKINRDKSDTWTEVHLASGDVLRFMGEDERTIQEWVTQHTKESQDEQRA